MDFVGLTQERVYIREEFWNMHLIMSFIVLRWPVVVDRTPYLITNELACFSCAFFYGHIVGTGIFWGVRGMFYWSDKVP